MAFVLDASSTLPWCFRDEATPASNRLLDRAIAEERIYVPANWAMEVLEGLSRAVRRGRLNEVDRDLFLRMLTGFDIAVDARSISEQWDEAKSLIFKHRLSAYDGGYLALALRLQAPLATFDGRLRKAAEVEGLTLAV